MQTILIATTQQQGLHAIGTAGQPVMQAYEQIARHLRQTLSEDHARLLAEPNVNPARGTVDWYAEGDGPAVRYADADPAQREAVGAKLARLRGDIEQRAAALGRSKEGGDRFLGQMLALALEVPSEDYIWCVGDQPVLVCWGTLKDTPNPERGVLRKMIPYRAPPGAAAAVSGPADAAGAAGGPGGGLVPAAATAGGAAAAAVTVVQAPVAWLAGLLWLLFALLVGAIFFLLLSGCGLGLPGTDWLRGQGLLLNYCPAAAARDNGDRRVLEAERTRQAVLEEALNRLRLGLATAEQNCRREALATPQPPPLQPEPPPQPAAQPEPPAPQPEPVVQPQPEPPPQPQAPFTVPPPPQRPEPPPEPPQQREPPRAEQPPPQEPPADREFDRRVDEHGGQRGDTMVTLTWNNDADLDLHVICPNGQRIFFQSPSGCGGRLDIDMNASPPLSRQPVENVVWPNGAPQGHYRVIVNNYLNRSQGDPPVPFRLRVVHGGQSRIVEGRIAHREGDRVFYEFDLP